MKSIAEVEESVNKELKYGKLIHSPIVAWAFDMSRARVGPDPVATGPHAHFLKNDDGTNFHLVPANPGFFMVSYVAELRREYFQKLTAEQRAELRKTGGSFELGVWGPEALDSPEAWRDAALMCEEDLIPIPAEPQKNPTDICGALHGGGGAA
jgi:hypothetical protein